MDSSEMMAKCLRVAARPTLTDIQVGNAVRYMLATPK